MATCVASPISAWSATLVPASNENVKTPKFAGVVGAVGAVEAGGVAAGVVVVAVAAEGVGLVGDVAPPLQAVMSAAETIATVTVRRIVTSLYGEDAPGGLTELS